ncbi:MAG: RDD family protein [Phycisphaeraceae bacterium]|nr:RDD family protein [Phycisphaeraceae bacterium]
MPEPLFMDLLTSIDLETPEQVELKLDLAGPASRFAAQMLDWLLQFIVIMVFVIVLVAADALHFMDMVDEMQGGVLMALTIAIVWVFLIFYGFLFEWLMHGRTPGKWLINLRVISESGGPPTVLALFLRNVLRFADFLPTVYMLGGIVCALNARHQRLGDMAAGTLVIREQAPDQRYMPAAAHDLPRAASSMADTSLTQEETQLLRRFFERRAELTDDARYRLARRLAEQLFRRHGGDHSLSDEKYLEALYQGVES